MMRSTAAALLLFSVSTIHFGIYFVCLELNSLSFWHSTSSVFLLVDLVHKIFEDLVDVHVSFSRHIIVVHLVVFKGQILALLLGDASLLF